MASHICRLQLFQAEKLFSRHRGDALRHAHAHNDARFICAVFIIAIREIFRVFLHGAVLFAEQIAFALNFHNASGGLAVFLNILFALPMGVAHFVLHRHMAHGLHAVHL